ncbi:MAG: hypothetical protein RR376_09165 [Janthinobacterium sp.]
MEVIGYLGNYHRRFRTKMVRKFGFEGFLLHCGAHFLIGWHSKAGSGLLQISIEKWVLRSDNTVMSRAFLRQGLFAQRRLEYKCLLATLVICFPECMLLRIVYCLKD